MLNAEAPSEREEDDEPKKTIRLSEVYKHGENAEEQWVTYKNRVYNITDWVPAHPGGQVILRAAGGAIDKYWDIFTIHKNKDVHEILETYFIGQVDPQDLDENGRVPAKELDDPFKTDPERSSNFTVHTPRPFNGEPPMEALMSFITPNDMFYIRNHLWVPSQKELNSQKLTVELPDGSEKFYTVEELKNKFKPTKITATMQCSGNRRSHMSAEARPAAGLPWDIGAISTSTWTGVRLRDILDDAGFPADDWPEDIQHVQFSGAEAYGASIPIDKAMSRHGDVIVAYEMNDASIPLDHGYPLRVIVPGHVAARSVKWVNRIVPSSEESTAQWQRRDYKCFGPNVSGKEADWESAHAIQEMPVQSAILSLRDVSTHSAKDRALLQVYGLEEDSVVIEGYAFAGGGRDIVRVDVSANDGRTWHQAEILDDKALGHKRWAWRRWRFVLPRSQAGRMFTVKAVDQAYNTQPGEYESYYNFKGNLTNSWHRVGYRTS